VRRRCQRPAVPPQWLADRGGHCESFRVTDGADPQLESVVLVAGDRQLSFGPAPARVVPGPRLFENTHPLSLPRRRTATTSPGPGRKEDGRNGKRTGNTGHFRSLQTPTVTQEIGSEQGRKPLSR
jgi:hypothetical protein